MVASGLPPPWDFAPSSHFDPAGATDSSPGNGPSPYPSLSPSPCPGASRMPGPNRCLSPPARLRPVSGPSLGLGPAVNPPVLHPDRPGDLRPVEQPLRPCVGAPARTGQGCPLYGPRIEGPLGRLPAVSQVRASILCHLSPLSGLAVAPDARRLKPCSPPLH
jgi:hypothetical protein